MLEILTVLGIIGTISVAITVSAINKKKVDNFIKTLEWVREDKAPRNFILNIGTTFNINDETIITFSGNNPSIPVALFYEVTSSTLTSITLSSSQIKFLSV